MKSQPGEELTCTARDHTFEQEAKPVKQGVMSYYSSQALAGATSVNSWLKSIYKLSKQDVKFGQLPESYLPSLQILGNVKLKLPGNPLRSLSEEPKLTFRP